MKHTELWNTARKLKLGNKFLGDFDTLLTSLESDNKQLIITDVVVSETEVCEHEYELVFGEGYMCKKCKDIYIDT